MRFCCYRANQSPRVYEKGAVDEEDQELRDMEEEADEPQDTGKEQEFDENEVDLRNTLQRLYVYSTRSFKSNQYLVFSNAQFLLSNVIDANIFAVTS